MHSAYAGLTTTSHVCGFLPGIAASSGRDFGCRIDLDAATWSRLFTNAAAAAGESFDTVALQSAAAPVE